MEDRIGFGFVPFKIPVVDEMSYRIFVTIEGYRKWSEKERP